MKRIRLVTRPALTAIWTGALVCGLCAGGAALAQAPAAPQDFSNPAPAPQEFAPPAAAAPQDFSHPAGAMAPQDFSSPPGFQPPQGFGQPQAAAPGANCEQSMMGFKTRRDAQLEQINNLVKAGKGKLDPIAACPKFKSLVAVESQMKAWMIKNKEWCQIPDQLLENVKQGFAKTPQYEKNACAAAAQMRRAAEGGGAGPINQPSVKLPAGPL